MKKIILFEGDIETQGYFSRQMMAALEKLGHEVYLYDLRRPWESTTEMMHFIEKGNTAVLSFNFHGCCQEPMFMDETGTYVWEGLSIPVCNILADHPYYYYNLLAQRPKLYYQLSIDGAHERFMKRFFPEVKLGPFMPLGGTRLDGAVRAGKEERSSEVGSRRGQDELAIDGEYARMEKIIRENKPEGDAGKGSDVVTIAVDEERNGDAADKAGKAKSEHKVYRASIQEKPIKDRSIDVLFTGNYASPKRFEQYITRNGDEYTAFYYEMINDLLEHPMQTVEDVVERYLRREIPEVTEAELKETMQNITFIDLYIRYTVRGEVVKTLADSGIKVHVFGDKWNELSVEHPENLIDGDSLFSEECLAKTCDSKICINVLPWFREGPHDRVFNTMLNGACLLTDTNPWLDNILRDGENCRIFDLKHLETLPQIVRELLADDNAMQAMADRGRETAKAHTWEKRMEVFHEWVETI